MSIMSSCKNQKIITPLGNTSIICRVVDEQRKLHFRDSIDKVPPSKRWLNAADKKKYTYKEISGGLFSGGKQMKAMLPKRFNNDVSAFNKHLKEKFKEYMGLK